MPDLFSRAALRPWLIAFAVFVGLILMLALASGGIPGVPDPPRKTVAVYYVPHAEGSPLALFLQPPLSVLDASGKSEPLALQFTNNTSSPIALEPIEVQPAACFRLKEMSEPVDTLQAGQTHVAWYELSVAQFRSPDSSDPESLPQCDGQHSLTIHYVFTAKADQTPLHPAGLVRSGRSVSTSPIQITSHFKLEAERFFRIAGAIAVPLILALATYLFQRFQSQKAEQQKEQELKLEVWKVIFPIIDGYIRTLYVPISRQMDLVIEEIKRAPTASDRLDLPTSLFILRALFERLGRKVGGFYFRVKSGEEVCGILSDNFWDLCYRMAVDKDKFIQSTEAVKPTDSIPKAKKNLLTLHHANPAFVPFQTRFQANLRSHADLAILQRHLELMRIVIGFETNILWYPEWYKTPPEIQFGGSGLSPAGLGLSPEATQEFELALKCYREELKKEYGLPKLGAAS